MNSDTRGQTSAVSNADISQNARRAARIFDRLPNGEHTVTFIKGENGWEIKIPGLHDWVFTANPESKPTENNNGVK